MSLSSRNLMILKPRCRSWSQSTVSWWTNLSFRVLLKIVLRLLKSTWKRCVRTRIWELWVSLWCSPKRSTSKCRLTISWSKSKAANYHQIWWWGNSLKCSIRWPKGCRCSSLSWGWTWTRCQECKWCPLKASEEWRQTNSLQMSSTLHSDLLRMFSNEIKPINLYE